MPTETNRTITEKEVEWIWEYLISDEEIEITRKQLTKARIQLLAGQVLSDWCQLNNQFFRQLGIVQFPAEKHRISLGHVIGNKGVVRFAAVSDIWIKINNSDSRPLESIFSETLKEQGIPAESIDFETFYEETKPEHYRVISTKATFILNKQNLTQIVRGKVWKLPAT